MPIASRTPEGFPSNCPVCGAETNRDFSEFGGDAPCPRCGCLIWQAEQLLRRIQSLLDRFATGKHSLINANTRLKDLGADSLDLVELVMELEEELNLNIADDEAEAFDTVGDLIRLLLQRHRQ
jgi:acyl carrier protein